jgi:hypothetical protein
VVVGALADVVEVGDVIGERADDGYAGEPIDGMGHRGSSP